LSEAEHVLRGTRRRPPRPYGLRLVGEGEAPDHALAPELLAGLAEGGLGRAFVERCWQDYDGWSPSTLVLLREAGLLIDALDALRGQKGERAAQRMLVTVLAALRLQA